jgi:arginyl-tRNA synthetase
MKTILELITEEMRRGFQEAGYDEKYAVCSLSNRPDLCEYQCNGALSAAKQYHKNPMDIAEAVTEKLAGSNVFASALAVRPGFINLKLRDAFLSDFVDAMRRDHERMGYDKDPNPKTVFVDYGGPNVAKPLHVGHLRAAVIGESVKRIIQFAGNNGIGDIHLGDWGTQLGQIICELQDRKPELPYFDPDFRGEYPKESPFTISELEDIYPAGSKKSKEDETFHKRAMEATAELQKGNRGYREIFKHIIDVSVSDMKKNYNRLNVHFELWKGESDAAPLIPAMIDDMKKKGLVYESNGALVMDVNEPEDKTEMPPLMILKSDGASNYNTTDLATLVWRMNDYHADEVYYVVDKRQDLHFLQLFRAAKKAGICGPDVKLQFIGFGTMNGKDGKPFKTRSGGVMRLSSLLDEIDEKMYEKIKTNHDIPDEEAHDTAHKVCVAAIKYGDLSNQASKDYIFDPDRFTAFEGNTGPYILYTIVRIKSILRKYAEEETDTSEVKLHDPIGESDKNLMLTLSRFSEVMKTAYDEKAPHKICAFVYDVCDAFNHFYHTTSILSESDKDLERQYISLLHVTERVLLKCIDLLGFEAPERM